MRPLPILAVLMSLGLTAAAAWLVARSPGSLDDVGAYRPTATPEAQPVEVAINPGLSPQDIGDRLEEAGAITSATQFEILVSLLGYEGRLQAGDYEFAPRTPALVAVYRIKDGLVAEHFVTVIEGRRLQEVADAAAAEGIDRREFIAAAYVRNFDYAFLRDARPAETLEGYLFPAKYPIRKGETARDVLNKILAKFGENLPPGVIEKADALGMNLHEVLTLASIIEREAQVAEERPVMAQVFLRRLQQGIPLQADPTVQYALTLRRGAACCAPGSYWKEELTAQDLEVDSPYNTYFYGGLPPGPICNPGLDSILAAVNPADTNYLYFVAKPDGSHAFASTLAEHQANIERYQGGQ